MLPMCYVLDNLIQRMTTARRRRVGTISSWHKRWPGISRAEAVLRRIPLLLSRRLTVIR